MKKRKWLAMLVVVALICMMLPVTALADTSSVYVQSVKISDSTSCPTHTVQCGEGTAVYDPDTQTLTLTNATIYSGDYKAAIEVGSNISLKIVLVGENSISTTVKAAGSMTFTGDGSLTINSINDHTSIDSWAAVTIDGATLNLKGDSALISQSLLIKNGAEITAEGVCGGISVDENLTVENSIITVSATELEYNGIYVGGEALISKSQIESSSDLFAIFAAGKITIDDSTVGAWASNDKAGIRSEDIVELKNDSTVTANGISSPNGYKIIPKQGSLVEVKAGTSEADAKHIEGSPFDSETALPNSFDGYFSSKVHVHEGGTATCTDKAVCEDCGKEYGDVNFDHHEGETEIKNAKDTTCTTEGYTGDKVCKNCNKVVEKGKSIAKIAHIYKDGKCTVCGASDPDYKPNQGNSDSPQTGDTSNIALWFVLMAAAGIGLAGTTVYGRKKHLQK